MEENNFTQKWNELKGDLQKTWGKLTDEDLEKTKKDLKSVSNLIKRKYDAVQQRYSHRIAEIFQNLEMKNDLKAHVPQPKLKKKRQTKVQPITDGAKNGQHAK